MNMLYLLSCCPNLEEGIGKWHIISLGDEKPMALVSGNRHQDAMAALLSGLSYSADIYKSM
jgi:hypothetical protein